MSDAFLEYKITETIDKIEINSYSTNRNKNKSVERKSRKQRHTRERMPSAVSILYETVFEVPSGADRMNQQ